VEITATQIANWAAGKNAQAALPRYIRRLIHDAGSITQIAVPAGDSTSQPGWDGEITSEQGNPWVPKGKSFWEMSCEAQATSKANDDYNKRTGESPENVRKTSTLVVVTARKWSHKRKWLAEKHAAFEWKEIRAYDADDLEQWLEQTPAVKLRFGDEIGLTGHGIEDVERHWSNWAGQTDVSITPEAFFVGRESVRDRVLTALRRRLNDKNTEPFTIRGDSVEEATAFVTAILQSQPDLCSTALVVTDPAGWRFVEQNASVSVVVAARPEIAEKPARRSGTIVVIPYAAGDMAGYFGTTTEAEMVLERPSLHEFEKALVSIGIDDGDAKRLSLATGRSWSVYRRRRAVNPSIRRPGWLNAPQAAALSTLCLLGGWSAAKPGDRLIVAELARQDYEHVEQNLRFLAQLDDAPILEIGQVWKAKSPLELLDLFGERITRDEINRFFQIAERVLVAADPVLELSEDQRYAAQIHGKVRPESGLLISTILDTLVKLSVRGPQIPALAAANIEARVSSFVRDLLHEADGVRWLSLASFLPDIAEAAPDMFLKCVEASLASPDAPVTQLLTETSGSGFMGRCWHAGMLWALERLAWAPERLTRVVLILARLGHTEIKGNWGNSPQNTLLDLFRSWIPQTAANLSQRISALDQLVKKEPDIAFHVLDRLVNLGPDTATPSARPNWRDDDAGAGRGVSQYERQEMLIAAADRLIASAKGNSYRIAKLIDKVRVFDPPRISATLKLAEEFTERDAQDNDREAIRATLRKKIHWQRNYGDLRGAALDSHLARLESLYERLAPIDPIARHRWLFSDSWPSLPNRTRDEGHVARSELVEAARLVALGEVYRERGLHGVEQLASACSNLGHVGASLAKLGLPSALLVDWIVKQGHDFSDMAPMRMTIRGLLRVSTLDRAHLLIDGVLDEALKAGWSGEKIARFLALAKEERETWSIVHRLGQDVENAYWTVCDPGFWFGDNEADFDFAIRHLIAARRPRSALQASQYDLKKVDPLLLAEMLEGLLRGEEPNGALLDSYHVGEALDRLEQSGVPERSRLISISFGLIPVLGYEGEHHAVSLYAALMSDPKLFTELICLVYRPSNRERDEPITEKTKTAATIAWQVLHACQRQPGTRPDGTMDSVEFAGFVDEVRRLCQEADRLEVCDSTLGQIFAHAPSDADGTWPPEPVRDVLDRPEMGEMRSGFAVGARNKRGMTSRAYDEGGGQERELAATYHAYARAVHNSHVHVAATLEQLASSYENDGMQEDLQARLRREGH
jgi:hypothetical protein